MILPMNETAPSSGEGGEVTRLLREFREGRPTAAAELLPLVYEQLRHIAGRRMSGERTDHTLQATALVHEVYLRLIGDRDLAWAGRAQFFAAAAEAMRRILIEHARSRGRLKRGGDGGGRGPRRQPINVLDLAAASEDNADEILMLEEALCRLEREDPDAARVVQLRFFAGLSIDDTASALGISPSSVDREWAYARARLFRLMSGP